jgi:hypothetical protein
MLHSPLEICFAKVIAKRKEGKKKERRKKGKEERNKGGREGGKIVGIKNNTF